MAGSYYPVNFRGSLPQEEPARSAGFRGQPSSPRLRRAKEVGHQKAAAIGDWPSG